MIRKKGQSLLRQAWHPSESDLLVYLDGEGDGKWSSRVETHLKSCWSCRVKREEIECLISAFIKSRDRALRNLSEARAGALLRLQARLDRLDSELGAPPFFSRLLVWLRRWRHSRSRFSVRSATLMAASVLLLVILWRVTSAPPVSAREILKRTQLAESQRIQKTAIPVVYRKLQLRRSSSAPARPEAVSWEIWDDVTHSRFRQRVGDESGWRFIAEESESTSTGSRPQASSAPPLLLELQQVLRANRMDAWHPLSAGAYDAWRGGLRRKTEEVRREELEDGTVAVALTTKPLGPFTMDDVLKAELVVRTEDWHPVEQRLEVQGKDEVRKYELTETGYDVLALNGVADFIFADLSPLHAPLTVAPITAAVPPLTEVATTPSTADLIAAEVEAHFALHRARACLGEALEVTREHSIVKVHGIVDNALRRDQLLEALRAIPLITVEIQTREEAVNADSLHNSNIHDPEEQSGVPVVDYTSQANNSSSPVQELLRRYFLERSGPDSRVSQGRSVNTEIVEFSNRAVSLSQSTLADAWALRRLAEWSETNKVSELRPQLTWLLEVMARDHGTAIRVNTSTCRNLLEPVLSAIVNRSRPTEKVEPSESSALRKSTAWESQGLALFSQIDQMDRLIRGLFADTGAAGYGEDSAVKLLAGFLPVDNQLAEFEAAVAAEFSIRPDALSMKEK